MIALDASSSSLFDGPGEMKARCRSTNWSATPLGRVETWSADLRSVLRLALNSGSPMSLHWGPELTVLYNDAFIPLMGLGKHEFALGRATKQVWPELWDDVIGPLMEQVKTRGRPVGRKDLPMVLDRNGYPEECYFTFSYNPVIDDDGEVVAVCNVSTETTRQVISERRLRLVRDLAGLSATRAGSTTNTCRAMLDVLAGTRHSAPFAAMVLREEGDEQLRCVGSYGIRGDAWGPGVAVTEGTPVGAEIVTALETGKVQILDGLRERLGDQLTPGPIGQLLPDRGVALPLVGGPGTRPLGAMVLGINPNRPLDEEYRAFLSLLAVQVGNALTDVKAYESERRQVRVLAELDLVKMQFFQNVSHELRTPLTLLLAPLQDLLDPDEGLRTDQVERVNAAVRAAGRLRRIVDALLDFAQAEANTLAAQREPVDVAKATANTASMFRSTAEHAGLRLDVTVPPDRTMALVDNAMWATIVTNLVANAVKFTRAGSIAVDLQATVESVVLSVTDTGIGISAEEQPKVFERFYRAQSSGEIEGAGIGLALVSDLVDAHHGHVALISSPGVGSTFTVTLPRGDHEALSATAVPSGSSAAAAGTDDTELVPVSPAGPAPGSAGPTRPTVLLVEDDPDLRLYLSRLLAADGWLVRAVPDAESADALLTGDGAVVVDLLLTDVMLPGIDGLELVTRTRAAPGAAARLPIIVLTARGGSGAATEGLSAGADDYVVKPFESGELLARVRTSHELHRLREREISTAQGRAGQMRNALDSNRAIGTATGVLMMTHRLPAAQAFALLTRASQDNNRKLRDLAAEVVAGGRLPFRETEIDHLLQRLRS
jgi:signal transduction histidine kinase/DNA-binding response OmpR family regulator